MHGYQYNIATGICFHCAILFIVVSKWSTCWIIYIGKCQTTVWASNKQAKHNYEKKKWKGVVCVCVSVVGFKNCVDTINIKTVETKSEECTTKQTNARPVHKRWKFRRLYNAWMLDENKTHFYHYIVFQWFDANEGGKRNQKTKTQVKIEKSAVK